MSPPVGWRGERAGVSIVLNHRCDAHGAQPRHRAAARASSSEAGVEETDAAVARAKAALPAWRARLAERPRRVCCGGSRRSSRSTPRSSRGSSRATSASRSRAPAARWAWSPRCFHFYAGAVDKHYGETIPVAGGIDATFREPLGVVGLIVPWNFPLNITSWKLGPALACAQHGRAQAGCADAALGAPPRRARARGGYPRGCRQRARRARLGRRHAPGRASRRRQDRLHRLDRGRAPGDARPRPGRSSA